ncbi:hypothetical protein RE476_09175 [Methanolobus mangrovi]|uniref:Uncharacterized protein n=1 Tax=Methanolobus mangrovi TaxID=3072977 RepID=A0AA51YIH7_9EURY|nr:hypothetical protein [Methanolobus mangrovi]WMW21558.1 hypothetical protein RE476_09175 [Methanolobus mangrovi]
MNFTKSDDAVSEMVDYSIILSIILLATGIIVVAGVPMLEHIQETQHTDNIKQSFQVLAPNVNKVVFGNAPAQSVELKMYGGSLSVTKDNYINISMQVWNNSAGSPETVSFGRQMGNIENDFQNTLICYENSGVWAKYASGDSVMVAEPRFTYANNVLVIPDASVSGSSSVSGSGLVRVTADAGRRSIESYRNVSQVNVTVTSDYFKAWEKFLNERLEMSTIDINETTQTVLAGKSYTENIDVYIIKAAMDVTID